jgi:cyclopropane fatty-acyl-phospholipid synthase-like methyltransferase
VITTDRTFNNPLSETAVNESLAMLELDASSVVVDIGCGRGEMLARCVERFGCRAVAADPREHEIERARERTASFADRVELHAGPIQDLTFAEPVDAAMCVGASHAYAMGADAFPATLAAFKRMVKHDGVMLLGEGYWRVPPDPEYLQRAGIDGAINRSWDITIAEIEQAGFVILKHWVSSKDDWDRFEGAFWSASQAHVAANPDDAEVQAQAAHWRNWRECYLKWGRDTMGFALFVLKRSP